MNEQKLHVSLLYTLCQLVQISKVVNGEPEKKQVAEGYI